ncbi:hypothetical protein V491_08820 [Pseudogymnoascus sp. VKM F-3775]|nr:hypothetical protein V491_08820 [Pseudogymnoascus sp. VKM F-3775]
MDRNSLNDYIQKGDLERKPLRQSQSKPTVLNPYPTPSPTANGNAALFYADAPARSNQTLKSNAPRDDNDARHKWPTPPYEGNDWSNSTAASIWEAGNRF